MVFDVNDKTINTLVDFTEEELKAFTLESMKEQSSLDEVKMLDQLHYQTFLTTTSSSNMSQVPVSSTTTMSTTSNIQQAPISTPVCRQILNEPMSMMSQLPDQPIPMQQFSTAQMMPQLQDQGAFTMLPMTQTYSTARTMPQLSAMIPMQMSTQMSTMVEPQETTTFQGIGSSMYNSTNQEMTTLPMTQTSTARTMPQLTAMIPMQMPTQMSTMVECQQTTSYQGIGSSMYNSNNQEMTTMPPPPPPLRIGSSMTYGTTNEMSDIPPSTPPLKQEYPITGYEWNYLNTSYQPQQSTITPSTFEMNQMRTLPSANTFNKPPFGFKSKIKTFMSLLRTMVPSVDDRILALLNIIDQNHYGSTMPDKGEIIFVTFNENLDVWFKRKYIDYAVEGKTLILLLKFIFKVFRIY